MYDKFVLKKTEVRVEKIPMLMDRGPVAGLAYQVKGTDLSF